jgi:integrase
MGRGTRTRLATGVYSDPSGVSIIVWVNHAPREYRYPLGKDANWYRNERIRLHAAALNQHARAEATKDTLAADVTRYLKTLTKRSKDDAENLLRHWLPAFGDTRRNEITTLALREHAASWTCAPSTYNHRRQALISLYAALDGQDAPNPARGLPKRQEQPHAPKALPYDVIRATFKAMPESQSKARLMLMAYTGLPQMQIEKLTPLDWQRDERRLRVTPRRKGAGSAGRWLPLSEDAHAAMELFDRLKCWGGFSRSSLNKAWKRYGPKGTNPYSLRHSWITELYRRSNGDVIAVQQLALHARLEQTQRYAAAAIEDRMAALVVPRNRSMQESKKTPKRSKTVQRGKRKHRGETR